MDFAKRKTQQISKKKKNPITDQIHLPQHNKSRSQNWDCQNPTPGCFINSQRWNAGSTTHKTQSEWKSKALFTEIGGKRLKWNLRGTFIASNAFIKKNLTIFSSGSKNTIWSDQDWSRKQWLGHALPVWKVPKRSGLWTGEDTLNSRLSPPGCVGTPGRVYYSTECWALFSKFLIQQVWVRPQNVLLYAVPRWCCSRSPCGSALNQLIRYEKLVGTDTGNGHAWVTKSQKTWLD